MARFGHTGHTGHTGQSGVAWPSGHTGHTGQTGVGFPGSNHSAAMMTALMLSREGIIGNWQPPAAKAVSRFDTASLEHLAGTPQAAVIDYELIAPVVINLVAQETDAPDGVAYLCHADALGSAPKVDLMRLAAPGADIFEQQLDYLHHYADLRADRMEEIDVQLSDLTSFFSALAHFHPARSKAIFRFIAAALRFCATVQFRIKHGFGCPRPASFSAQVQPMIQTPDHGTLPSGHATEAIFLATLFKAMAEELATTLQGDAASWLSQFCSQCDRLAVRIAVSRTVAGVHFPVDSAAGAVLGDTLARYVLARVQTPAPNETEAAPLQWRQLDAQMQAFGASDYNIDTLDALRTGCAINDQTVTTLTTVDLSLRHSPQLHWLWQTCVDELHRSAALQEA